MLFTSPFITIFLIYLTYFINPCISTFIKSHPCSTKQNQSKLQPFIINVALDTHQKKLKFFINSQVALYDGINTDRNPAITNYNSTTNRSTSLQVQINFMGKQFINETKNFCDLVSVKNTTSFRNSPRFVKNNNNTTNNNDNDSDDPLSPMNIMSNSTSNETSKAQISNINSLIDRMNRTSLGSTDSTITELFSNSTGNLVQCPLYYNDSIMIYYEADVSEHYHRLGSYQIVFKVLDNDKDSKCIGCSKTYVTPVQPAFINDAITIGILVIMAVSTIVNIFTVSFSSYQESTNPYLFRASTICNEKLLNQIDASVPDIIMYLQYALFLGGLDLLYPGFYQPMLSQISWCALLNFSIIGSSSPWDDEDEDNVYVTMASGGLSSLTLVGNNNPIVNNWPNFMAILLIVIVIVIVGKQLFIGAKLLFDKFIELTCKKTIKNPSPFQFWSKKNVYLVAGQILQMWLVVFGMPFLILSSFLFLSANDINGKHRSLTNFGMLKKGVFSFTTPYNELIIPNKVFSFGLRASSLEGFHQAPIPKFPLIDGPDKPKKTDNDDNWLTSAPPPNSTFNNTLLHSNLTLGGTKLKGHDCDYMNISNASVALSSILFSIWILFIAFFIFHYLLSFYKSMRIKTSSRINKLYTNLKTILLWSFLYYEYKPQRVKCVIINLAILFSNSMVVGLLQSHGLVQVILLIIIAVIDLFQIFVLRPYFAPLKIWSIKSMFPVARFLCAMLCIGFVREINADEAVRTIIAYIHLLIHAIVSFIFVFQLIFWFSKTCVTIYKSHKTKQEDKLLQQLSNIDSIDEFERQFEYKAITSFANKRATNNLRNETTDSDVYSMDGVDEEFLFRGGVQAADNLNSDDIISIAESQTSFLRQQHESNLRKLKNDYKVREADQIYEKYFVDDKIDPEVKELWESRKKTGINNGIGNSKFDDAPSACATTTATTASPIFLSKLKKVANRGTTKSPKESSFHVSRPRQLVVKSLQQIQQEQLEKQQKLNERLQKQQELENQQPQGIFIVNNDDQHYSDDEKYSSLSNSIFESTSSSQETTLEKESN
ncbi:hypothetical protein KGF54_000918 [Candida jiufengensis]|uniref:uncharacterized protein n=1 Tax=Candida jiufengensis TaxID=497108 RepID=UPI002224CED8|nr:uncharacterized protein KGF54_000918 [Candida jiufengensis]KAI5956443.1 hypothetical protein KGF54_000918 [Candida jiufengensis]